jgi:tetratricopeptide (TPR) repeat protein
LLPYRRYNTLLERISEEENFPKEELITVLYQVWEHYFPIGEEGDLAYCLGTILGYFGHDRDAIKLFQTSLEFYGEDAGINYEVALCYYNLEEYNEALEYVKKSLLLDADYEESKKLKELIADILNNS